jgi:pyruvate/2-oxoacid:ferredoxin oxidoreductase beta subunit
VKEYLQTQGRFRQMTEEMIKDMQERTDKKWEELLSRV